MATNSYNSSLSRYRRYLETVRSRPLWRATLYLIFSLILLIVLVTTALRPTVVTIFKLISDIEKYKQLNAKLDEKIFQIQKAQEVYADRRVAPRIGLLDQGLPIDPKYGVIAQTLGDMAKESNLKVTNIEIKTLGIKPADVKEVSGLNTGYVKFEVIASGQYDQVKNFIVRVENWRRVIDMQKVSISNQAFANGQEAGNELNLSIEGIAGFVPL